MRSRPHTARVPTIRIDNLEWTDLVDNPGTVEVPVFRRLPPAEASRSRAGFQGYLQGDVPAHVAGVAEKELLKETPWQATIERILKQHRLAPGVRDTFTTSQSHEELHKSDMRKTDCRFFFFLHTSVTNSCYLQKKSPQDHGRLGGVGRGVHGFNEYDDLINVPSNHFKVQFSFLTWGS